MTAASTIFGTPVGALILEEIKGHLEAFFDGLVIDEAINYEVEAKFGQYVDNNTRQRISLPILTTCVLAPADWYRFEADLGMDAHKHYNRLLNEQVAQNNVRWRYRHERTVDTFYTSTADRKKLRASCDAKTGNLIETIEKRRLGDLAIHIPACSFDVRISINTETVIAGMTKDKLNTLARVENERFKDRVSYEYEKFIKVDLTQVKTGSTTRHELEVELVDIRKSLSDDKELCIKFLSNILDIARISAI